MIILFKNRLKVTFQWLESHWHHWQVTLQLFLNQKSGVSSMGLLLDTNVLVQTEGPKALAAKLQKLPDTKIMDAVRIAGF